MRQQFEQWLAQVADDNDTARADRLTALFERSVFTRQKDLAEALDVETRTVQRWLAGDGIAKRYWMPLADALDTTVRFLIFGEEEREPIDESQLDRMEAKLDDIIAMLGDALTRVAALELGASLEPELPLPFEHTAEAASTPTRRTRSRRAS